MHLLSKLYLDGQVPEVLGQHSLHEVLIHPILGQVQAALFALPPLGQEAGQGAEAVGDAAPSQAGVAAHARALHSHRYGVAAGRRRTFCC